MNNLPEIKEEMSLSELTEAFNDMFTLLQSVDGELSESVDSMFVTLTEKTARKVDGYKFLIDKLKAEAAFWDEQAEQRAKVADRCAKLADHLENRMEGAMVAMGTKELCGNAVKARLVPNQRVLIENETLIPDVYKKTTITTSVSKEKLKVDLKEGVVIPGAKLEKTEHIRFFGSRPK